MSDRHVDQLPSPGLKRALTLVRNLEELQRATTTLLDRVESVTTLRAGEVWVLTALASAPARLDALEALLREEGTAVSMHAQHEGTST